MIKKIRNKNKPQCIVFSEGCKSLYYIYLIGLTPPHPSQVSKKDRSEPKTLTITPSESTHFRVIPSSEAMEAEAGKGEGSTDPVCTVIKPEPRNPKSQLHCSKHQPSGAVSEAHCSMHNTCVPQPEPSPSKPVSEPRPLNSDLCTSKPARRTRWTSSPPNRRDSGSATCGASHMSEDPAAECPDTMPCSKATDTPSKRRGSLRDLVL